MSIACDVKTDRKQFPLNFEVVGNDNVLFVSGAADPTITSLLLVLKPAHTERDIPLHRAGDQPANLFGFAAKPGSVYDLIGRDARGNKIASGGAKIRSTSNSDAADRPS